MRVGRQNWSEGGHPDRSPIADQGSRTHLQGRTFVAALKANPKVSSNPEEPFFRIAYDDVMGYRFVIRRTPDPENSFWSEEATVIATYGSIADIVDDG
jgi:hypothetical protein